MIELRIVLERMMELRSSEKGFMNANGDNQLFGVDFHQFLEREKDALNVELASEFGLSLKEVKLLKKKMERS